VFHYHWIWTIKLSTPYSPTESGQRYTYDSNFLSIFHTKLHLFFLIILVWCKPMSDFNNIVSTKSEIDVVYSSNFWIIDRIMFLKSTWFKDDLKLSLCKSTINVFRFGRNELCFVLNLHILYIFSLRNYLGITEKNYI
jgi:hypothetical protein